MAAYRQGATAVALANTFGCSPNTVSRVVKAVLSSAEVAALKQQRGRGESLVAGSRSVAEAAVQGDGAVAGDRDDRSRAVAGAGGDRDGSLVASGAGLEAGEGGEDVQGDDGPGVLAIDDADDFAGDDGDSEMDQGTDQDGDERDDFGSEVQARTAEPGPGAGVEAGLPPVQCRHLSDAPLPAAAYLLVDKTVELQPVILSDCPDLGPLPEEEATRQALQVYVNPRQAKRQCGRSQRVIPLPDLTLLQRTAPFLLAQGISRVVIEGSLYSLPGS